MPLYNPVLAGLPSGGADGQVLTKQSATNFDADWETPAGGSSLPLQLPIQDEHYYGFLTDVGLAATAFGFGDFTDYITAMPVIFTEDVTWTEIGVQCSTGDAGDLARLGIYADNNGVPGALLVDAGEIDCSTSGTKVKTINQALSKNTLYWRAIAVGGDAAVLWGSDGEVNQDSVNSSVCDWIFGRRDVPGAAGTLRSVYAPHTYGALPDPFPSIEDYYNFSAYIWLRTGV